jgi:hypothetical protein
VKPPIIGAPDGDLVSFRGVTGIKTLYVARA